MRAFIFGVGSGAKILISAMELTDIIKFADFHHFV